MRSTPEGAAASVRGLVFGDAVLLAQVFDIGIDVRVHLATGAGVGVIARDGLVEIVARGDKREDHAARVPAEAAIGLPPECEGQTCFGVGEQDGEVDIAALADLLSGRGAASVDDHEDHQRPEAEHDAEQGRDVTQQPQGEAPAFHGRDYKRAGDPADLRCPNPPIF